MLSVILPTYNCEDSICQTLDSVLAQKGVDLEIIVINDGSTDSTEEKIQTYMQYISYYYQDNAGVCAARNKGIKLAKYEWIAFIDHDDLWHPEKASKQIELINNNPSLAWCATNHYRNDGNRIWPVISPRKMQNALGGKGYFNNFFIAEAKKHFRLMPTTVMIKKNILLESGMFDENLSRCEDTDLWCRIALKYPAIGAISTSLATRNLYFKTNKRVQQLRLNEKTGERMRNVLKKYIEPSKEAGQWLEYKEFARKELNQVLLTTICYGLKKHTYQTLDEFPYLFPFHIKVMAHILSLFPNLTSRFLLSLAEFGYSLNILKEGGRRRLYQKQAKKFNCN